MNNENKFLITYGLHGFVQCDKISDRSVFNISGSENRKMVNHAASLIHGRFGSAVDIHVV